MRSVAWLASALLGLAACAGIPVPPPSSDGSGTATAAPVLRTATAADVSDLFRQRRAAIQRSDLGAFQATYDRARPVFRRCQEESFQTALRAGAPDVPEVLKVEPYGDGYTRAYVATGQDVSRVYLRADDRGGFVLTEPRIEELGAEQRHQLDGVEIVYRPADADLLPLLEPAALATRDFLGTVRRVRAPTPLSFRLYTTREQMGLQPCAAFAQAFTLDPKDPHMRFYGFYFDRSLRHLSPFMEGVLRHEALHLLQEVYYPRLGARIGWYLWEGWPDYVGKIDRSAPFRSLACRGGPAPTLKQLSDGPSTDIDTQDEVRGAYYVWANTMVEFLYSRWNEDAYFALLDAYRTSVDPNVVIPAALGTSAAAFYDGWIASAKRKYC